MNQVKHFAKTPMLKLFFHRFCFFLSGFVSQTFMNHRTARKGGGHSINSSLPLPTASQTLRHQQGDYCRELTSENSQQPDFSQEPLFSECKLLTTKLRGTYFLQKIVALKSFVVYKFTCADVNMLHWGNQKPFNIKDQRTSAN